MPNDKIMSQEEYIKRVNASMFGTLVEEVRPMHGAHALVENQREMIAKLESQAPLGLQVLKLEIGRLQKAISQITAIAHTMRHTFTCRSRTPPDEPNPDGGDFCPGFGICDCARGQILKIAEGK